ncbi:MAG TPA: FAD-binding oxidoreductase [Casimicrobiaceae bacterium]|nr:FAD-binding oxidoreductase [Casimicrobiaceae bacterium]
MHGESAGAASSAPQGESAALQYRGLIDTPYWWDAAPPQTRDGPLPSSVDVLIVGSGFTGLSASLTLARGGRSVLVCDSHEIGFGASTRNGGHISAKMRRSLASIAAEHGDAKAEAAWNVAKSSRAYLEQLIRTERIDCDFQTCVRYYGAHRPKDYETLAQTARTLKLRVGLDVEAVPKAEQHRYVNADAYHGGLVDRGTAAFHPAKYVAGLCRRAEEAGATMRSHTKVTGLHHHAGGFRVTTSSGIVEAQNVIVATNGYTGPEFPWFARRIIPIGSYIIATEPLDRKTIDALMPGCELVIDTRRAASYMRTSPDRTRILYGGRVAATDISALTSAPRLKAVLDSIFPALHGARVSHSWMGFTGFTFDELPHLGNQDGIYFAMGYCGTGTAMATYLGHLIARRILGVEQDPIALEDLEFKTKSFYRGNPWFLSTVIAGYRLLDRLHI